MLVKTKHEIGKRINEDELKFKKPKYGNKRVENLAKDLDISRADLYYCIQFAKKYPDFENSNALENSSWREIIKLLPKPKKPDTPPLPEGKYNIIYADPPGNMIFQKQKREA
ncbi:MAG: hypothetical protein KAW92_11505 [Candidatus Cloacimonetes bacterium]|nr:hypothetical protein [Candidatus Cloacimonadota bacterium]